MRRDGGDDGRVRGAVRGGHQRAGREARSAGAADLESGERVRVRGGWDGLDRVVGVWARRRARDGVMVPEHLGSLAAVTSIWQLTHLSLPLMTEPTRSTGRTPSRRSTRWRSRKSRWRSYPWWYPTGTWTPAEAPAPSSPPR